MSTEVPAPAQAWEPLTPRGVASFARSRLWRLLLIQCVVALLAAGAVAWFLEVEWFPVVRAAIQHLPAQGEIRGGQLNWPGDTPTNLAENHFLGIAVDLNHNGQMVHEAQLLLEFGRHDLREITVPGFTVSDYPLRWRLPFNRTELDPWWGAWEPAIVAGAAILTFIGLLVAWTILATVYCVPVKVITLYAIRDLSLVESWRLAGAALMPGALFFTFGIVFYGLSAMALTQLAVIACLHVVIGWIYLFISPMFLPRHPEATVTTGNPFDTKRKPKN